MKLAELANYFDNLADNIMSDVPDIVAETANEYFKESFNRKGFDGKSWPPARTPKHTGSLLVESGALMNSIRPTYVGPDKVVISAGNEKAGYAQAHNEGFTGSATIPAHTRRTKFGPVNVKAHSRRLNLPQRQFMGDAREHGTLVVNRIEAYIASQLSSSKTHFYSKCRAFSRGQVLFGASLSTNVLPLRGKSPLTKNSSLIHLTNRQSPTAVSPVMRILKK